LARKAGGKDDADRERHKQKTRLHCRVLLDVLEVERHEQEHPEEPEADEQLREERARPHAISDQAKR
jgi:hypothetical protein